MEEGLDIEVVLDQLRVELAAMQAKAADESLQFTLETVDVSLQVAVTRERTMGGKAKFWVLDASGATKSTQQTTHTIQLRMRPKAPTHLSG